MRTLLLGIFGAGIGHVYAALSLDDRAGSQDRQDWIDLTEVLVGALIGILSGWLWGRMAKWRASRHRLAKATLTQTEGVWPPPPNKPPV